jgi:hypothetical protein
MKNSDGLAKVRNKWSELLMTVKCTEVIQPYKPRKKCT